MSTVTVSIWFEGDVGGASIEYAKTYKGDDLAAHDRLLREAQKKFPNWSKIKIENSWLAVQHNKGYNHEHA